MMPTKITIIAKEAHLCTCMSAIAVPDAALTEAGHIRTFTVESTVQSKHEFYTLSQVARIQFEDGELVPQIVAGSIRVEAGDEAVEVAAGLLICRHFCGELAVFSNADRSIRKFFEVAERFCTRWIRLDI